MRQIDLTAIRELELFADMAPERFEEMMRAVQVKRLSPHVQFIRQGEAADFLHILVEGSVELFAAENSRETILAINYPVATINLAAVIRDAPYLTSARTISPSQVLMINTQSVRAILMRDADFARSIAQELSDHNRDLVQSLKNQKLHTSVERLADYLLCEHKRQGSHGALKLPIKKQKLAALLGIVPESLSRTFYKLRSFGVLVNRNNIEVKNLSDLEALSKANHLPGDP